MSTPNLIEIARSCVAASASATDPLVAAYYGASARVAIDKLAEDLRATELLVALREAALVRQGAPKVQLEIGAKS